MIKTTLFSMILLSTLLVFAGCSAKDTTTDTQGETQSEVAQDSEATVDTTADAPADFDVSTVDASVFNEIDYETGLDANGFYENIRAKDYVELFDYSTLTVPAEIHTISDAMLQTEIDGLMTSFVTSESITDRVVVDGDTVNIDYVGSIDGVDFDGGNTGGNGADVTIGVTSYIDDFLQQLIGHMPGDTFDVLVTFPADYGVENLNGKEAVFVTTINHINQEISPELTDAFVAENLADINGWTTIEEMKAGILKDLQGVAVQKYIQADIFGQLTVKSTPEPVMDYQKSVMDNYYKGYANQSGLPLEEFLQQNTEFQSVDDLYVAYSDQLTEVARFTLIIQAIAEETGISVTEADMKSYFMKYRGVEDYSDLEDAYGIAYLKYTILQELIMDYLVENATLL